MSSRKQPHRRREQAPFAAHRNSTVSKNQEGNNDAFRPNRLATWLGGVQRTSVREILSAYVALFASLTTLFCCALPALLMLLGFGLTSVLTFFTAIPGWENFGTYNIWLFPLGGVLLAVGFYFAYFRQGPSQGEACSRPAGGRESACSTSTGTAEFFSCPFFFGAWPWSWTCGASVG